MEEPPKSAASGVPTQPTAMETQNEEVSLPGSNESSLEQPAILQVLSQLNAPEENEKLKTPHQELKPITEKVNVKQSVKDAGQHNDKNVNDINDKIKEEEATDDDNDHNSCSLKNLVSSSSNENSLDKSLLHEKANKTTKDCKVEEEVKAKLFADVVEQVEEEIEKDFNKILDEQEILNGDLNNIDTDNILDIESHLIETLNEIVPSEESVGINELQPAEIELQVGCSKIETKDNVRSVIEVEPAELITKKQIEQILAKNDPLQAAQSEQVGNNTKYSNGEIHVNQEEIEEVAKQLIQNIEDEVIKAFEENSYKGQELLPEREIKTDEVEEQEFVVEDQVDSAFNAAEAKLSQVVDQHLSEVTSILESQSKPLATDHLQVPEAAQNIKLVTVPSPQTALEEAERKLFIDSLPALEGKESTEAEKLALDCKREYYQSLKKYLIQSNTDKPPRPLQTYRWEDLRRAKERGGYPWTHLYKRPLGPDEEPEIVLMLRKSQEIRFLSESPKSNKKVRIDDQVLIQETHPYLQELSEEEEEEEEGHHSEHHLAAEDHENHSLHSESFSCVSDSVLATAKSKAANRFSKVRRLFRRRRFGNRSNDDIRSLPDTFANTSLPKDLEKTSVNTETQQFTKTSQQEHPIYEHPKSPRCFPIMKKLKSMAERQKKRLNIKRIHLIKDDKVAPQPDEEPRIIRLKESPKSQRSDIAHFVEKQDSDDVLEIVELDESPSRKRLGRQEAEEEETEKAAAASSIVKPEEIIELGEVKAATNDESEEQDATKPPKKAPRLRREHVYEEIDQTDDSTAAAAEELKFILDATSVEALKQSLATQDNSAVSEVNAATKIVIPLDRMGSSEEEAVTSAAERATPERKSNNSLLAPISSIDSASSDEDRNKTQLQPVTEEEQDEEEMDMEKESQHFLIKSPADWDVNASVKPLLKKEASPAPSDKKVTFSHIEDEADPHREDVELSAEQMEAAKEANKLKNASK